MKYSKFVAGPIIFIVVYYVFSFQAATVIGLLYLFILTLALAFVNEKIVQKLAQIIAHHGGIDPKKIQKDFENIKSADDLVKFFERKG